jgi:hypothetical protein
VQGTPFGRFRLIEVIGEGGMGKVYKAHDTVIDRHVAVKVDRAREAGQIAAREALPQIMELVWR